MERSEAITIKLPVTVASLGDLPPTGEMGVRYRISDLSKTYVWLDNGPFGNQYVELAVDVHRCPTCMQWR
jgi:hypothetical protein